MSSRTLYNLVAAMRRKYLQYGSFDEAARLIERLAETGRVEYTLDEEGRLHTMVYMSRQGQCIVQMRHWNDVLTIDATHKTNRYRFCTCMEALSITARLAHVIAAFCCTCTSTLLHHSHRWNMVVVLICLIGPNGRTMHIGDLIMRSEAAENYTTAFQLLDLCAGCPLSADAKAVFTDGLPAYDVVVPNSFPNAHHCRCRWHVQQQFTKHLSSKMGTHWKVFWEHFREAMHATSVTKYQFLKATMLTGITKFVPASRAADCVKYVEDFLVRYETKVMECYVMQHRTLGTRSTQRSESLNSVAKAGMTTTAFLGNFMDSLTDVEFRQAQTMRDEYDRSQVACRAISPQDEAKYYNTVSPYAAGKFSEQVRLATTQVYTSTEDSVTTDNDGITVRQISVAREGRIAGVVRLSMEGATLKEGSCSCGTWVGEGICCRHMTHCLLSVAGIQLDTLASEALFSPRWRASNFGRLSYSLWGGVHGRMGAPQQHGDLPAQVVTGATSHGVDPGKEPTHAYKMDCIVAIQAALCVVAGTAAWGEYKALLNAIWGLLGGFGISISGARPPCAGTCDDSECPTHDECDKGCNGAASTSSVVPGNGEVGDVLLTPHGNDRQGLDRDTEAAEDVGDADGVRTSDLSHLVQNPLCSARAGTARAGAPARVRPVGGPGARKLKRNYACANCGSSGHRQDGCQEPCARCRGDHKLKECPQEGGKRGRPKKRRCKGSPDP